MLLWGRPYTQLPDAPNIASRSCHQDSTRVASNLIKLSCHVLILQGMVNMSELRKITEVPFPFPYSQFLGHSLVLVHYFCMANYVCRDQRVYEDEWHVE